VIDRTADIATREQVLAACEEALALAPPGRLPDLPPTQFSAGEPDWYPFEHQAWGIGETIWRGLRTHRGLRRDPATLEKILQVANCQALRRGRQSFILSLGFSGASHLAEKLALMLGDSDVEGHVASALLKMRAPGFAKPVERLLASDRGWVRRTARLYLDRLGGATAIKLPRSPSRLKKVRGGASSELREISTNLDRDDLEPLLHRLSRLVPALGSSEVLELVEAANNLKLDRQFLVRLDSDTPLEISVLKDDEESYVIALFTNDELARDVEALVESAHSLDA